MLFSPIRFGAPVLTTFAKLKPHLLAAEKEHHKIHIGLLDNVYLDRANPTNPASQEKVIDLGEFDFTLGDYGSYLNEYLSGLRTNKKSPSVRYGHQDP
jgi:hypothetical protein